MTTDTTSGNHVSAAEELMKKRREHIRSRRIEKINGIVNIIPSKNHIIDLFSPDMNIA